MASDPHSDDYCLSCGMEPTVDGPTMHPVVGLQDAVLCEECASDMKRELASASV